MMQLSPYVLRTAMLMEELGDESKRAAYMVISDMHRLQEALRKMADQQDKDPLTLNDTIKFFESQ